MHLHTFTHTEASRAGEGPRGVTASRPRARVQVSVTRWASSPIGFHFRILPGALALFLLLSFFFFKRILSFRFLFLLLFHGL